MVGGDWIDLEVVGGYGCVPDIIVLGHRINLWGIYRGFSLSRIFFRSMLEVFVKAFTSAIIFAAFFIDFILFQV